MFRICLKRINFLIWKYRSKLVNRVTQIISPFFFFYLFWLQIYLDFLFYFLSYFNFYLNILKFFLVFLPFLPLFELVFYFSYLAYLSCLIQKIYNIFYQFLYLYFWTCPNLSSKVSHYLYHPSQNTI